MGPGRGETPVRGCAPSALVPKLPTIDAELAMIYCVIPPELADDLYDKLVDYYRDNPNVEVIVDRRASERRKDRGHGSNRTTRERRRVRIPGTFPRIDAH
jgi:hypothetical protein